MKNETNNLNPVERLILENQLEIMRELSVLIPDSRYREQILKLKEILSNQPKTETVESPKTSLLAQFVPFNESLLMKLLGFNDNCLAYYDRNQILKPVDTDFIHFREVSDDLVKSPTYSQAFKWFKNKHGLHSFITGDLITYDVEIWDTRKHLEIHRFISTLTKDAAEFTKPFGATKDAEHYLFGSYEEAELACLRKLIEITQRN